MTRVEDVITRDFVENQVRELVEGDLIYRNVFRGIDATSIGSNAYTFNIAEDDMGRVQVVPEGAEPPRHSSSVRQVTVTFDKYAGEVSLTMEAQEDGLLDMKAREVEDLGRAMDVTLEEEAYNELTNNVQPDPSGDADDTMTFADIRDGIIALRKNHYTPDTLILDLDAYGDLLTAGSFNRATDAGDNLVRTGEVGQVAGLDVIVDNRHNINGGHGGYLIDSDRYGYELRRTPMATNRYSDDARMADNIQVYTRRTWKALFEDAAVQVDG